MVYADVAELQWQTLSTNKASIELSQLFSATNLDKAIYADLITSYNPFVKGLSGSTKARFAPDVDVG